jgi:hypothetical protein
MFGYEEVLQLQLLRVSAKLIKFYNYMVDKDIGKYQR